MFDFFRNEAKNILNLNYFLFKQIEDDRKNQNYALNETFYQ